MSVKEDFNRSISFGHIKETQTLTSDASDFHRCQLEELSRRQLPVKVIQHSLIIAHIATLGSKAKLMKFKKRKDKGVGYSKLIVNINIITAILISYTIIDKITILIE